MLIIDLETRSPVDLKTAGSYLYGSHPDTEILCIGWELTTTRTNRGCVDTWEELPEYVRLYIQEGDGLVGAWNAQFDRHVWEHHMPDDWQIPLSRWYCLAAQARVNALPASLDKCAKAMTGYYKKDIRGPALIKAMSIPPYEDTPQLRQEMREYCMQDVRLSTDLHLAMRTMTPNEHRDYINSELINDDGVMVDQFLARHAIDYAEQETEELATKLDTLTNGAVTKHTQHQRVKQWVFPRLTEEQLEATYVTKRNREKDTEERKQSLDKDIRPRLLEDKTIDPTTREVLELVDAGNKSSVAKFQRMVERAGDDDRVRGAFVYAGASQTLRFSSQGLQLHNFTRDCYTPEMTEEVIDHMEAGKPLENTMSTLSKMLRPAIIPDEGSTFIVGDWKGIEACALPWLAGDPTAQSRLNILKDPDRDIYVETQNQLRLPSRQLGKVVELSMGYGGATGAFMAMAKAYGVEYDEDKVKSTIVDPWRAANTWAHQFWMNLAHAAVSAMKYPGQTFSAGRVSYRFYEQLLPSPFPEKGKSGTLVCTLPSGGMIQYPQARLEIVETEHNPVPVVTSLKANWTPAAGEKEWPRIRLWRGLLAENVTQAFCADLLRDLIARMIQHDWPVVAHCHDEVVAETDKDYADEDVKALTRLMEEVPSWAEGLPLIADVKAMSRYGK